MTSAPHAQAAPDKRSMIRRITKAGAIGNFIEFFDFTLYGFFSVTIATLFFPEYSEVAALLATFALLGVGFVVRPLGATFFGHVGDRVGRKRALLLAVLLMSLSTTFIGLLPTHAAIGVAAPLLLLVCRLAQGFSTGGEQTGAFVLVIEHSPLHERGRNAATLLLAVVGGVGAAALAALAVTSLTTPEQLASWGWRLPFLLALPLGVLGLYLRLNIEDSEAFRATEAVEATEGTAVPLAQAFRTVKKEMLTLFGWVSMQSLAGYIIVGYMFSHLVRSEGYPMSRALIILIVAHAAAMVVLPITGRVADATGRRRFAVTLSVLLGVWVVPAFVLLGHGMLAATVALSVYAALQYSTNMVSGLATVELFPVDVRYTASAIPFQVSSVIFGGTAALVSTWLVDATGSKLAPAVYLMLMCAVVAVMAWRFLPSARAMNVSSTGRSLPGVDGVDDRAADSEEGRTEPAAQV